jgi:hypothetical protein
LMMGKLIEVWFGVVALTFGRHTPSVWHGCVSGSSVQHFKVAHYRSSEDHLAPRRANCLTLRRPCVIINSLW